MRFALTTDQIALRDAVHDLLAKEPPDAPTTVAALVEMGVTMLLVPVDDGGVGMDEVAAAVILEEVGYAGVEEPMIAAVLGDEPDHLTLGAAAQLMGLGQRMLDLTVDYVQQRHQFGVPVGSFQAVKHQLADALKDLSFARPAVRRAAWSMAAREPTVERDVSMAKAMASDAAARSGRAALQCHGAIGYTVEYDLHRFLKQTWKLTRAFGDAAWHRERIARTLEMP
jgi:alkylation response protein AidB-like acyl-CoA dehydrogenase